MTRQFPFQLTRLRPAGVFLWLLAATSTPTWAQFTPDALENAASLNVAVSVLNAGTAQPSTYLLLDAPDVAVPGKVRAIVSSELRGTSTLVLVRGKFQPGPTSARGQAPVPVNRKFIGERPPDQPPTIWLASAPFKAGEPARMTVDFEIDKTETVTLFAQAQGRWWFVTKEIKVGQPPDLKSR